MLQVFDFKYTNPKYLTIFIVGLLLIFWLIFGKTYGNNIGFLIAGIIASITGIGIFYSNYRIYGKSLF